jgi:hypothetical protein
MAEELIRPDYRLRLIEHADFLQVDVFGDTVAQATRIAYWQELLAEARARGQRKLLVIDCKKGPPATPQELAELAAVLQFEGRRLDRVAWFETTVEFLPAVEHAEIFGQGLGINVRIFGDRAEAERWLRYGSPDD